MKKIVTKLIELDDLTMESALDWVVEHSATDGFKYVVTPNIDHLDRLTRNRAEYGPLYANADLCICDSRILKVLLKLKKISIESVVPGSDLSANLLTSPQTLEKKVMVFGGTDAIFDTLKLNYLALNLFHINPSMGFINKPDEVALLTQQILSINPDILLLAVGSPQQEKFAMHLQQHLNHGVALCIGASILFLTGEEKRAPVVFQKLHLEWLFRMLVAPRLIKRYFQNFLALGSIYRNL